MVRPSAEEVAEKGLRLEGYRVYLPRYRKMLRPHGDDRREQPSMRPAFQGYLFAQDWRGWPKHAITGVVGLMMKSGNRPRTLSAEDVDKIRHREWQGLFDDKRMPAYGKQKRDDLAAGDEVEYIYLGERLRGVLSDLSENGQAIIREITKDGVPTPITKITVQADDLELVRS